MFEQLGSGWVKLDQKRCSFNNANGAVIVKGVLFYKGAGFFSYFSSGLGLF